MRYLCKECQEEQDSVEVEQQGGIDGNYEGETLEELEWAVLGEFQVSIVYKCPNCGTEVDISEIFDGEIYELSQKKGEVAE